MEGGTSERNRGTENKNQLLIVFLNNQSWIPSSRKVHFTYHEGRFLQDRGECQEVFASKRNDFKDPKKMTNHIATLTEDILIANQGKVKSLKS